MKDVETLEKIHISLCITKETIDAIHADICGSLFEKQPFLWDVTSLTVDVRKVLSAAVALEACLIKLHACVCKETKSPTANGPTFDYFSSLFYSALLGAREMLIPEEVSSNLVKELNNRLLGSRIKILNFVQQLLEYTRTFRVNLVLYYLIMESFPCIHSERSMQC